MIERIPAAPGSGTGPTSGEESAWKNCWNWNLCDAANGSLVLDIRNGRVSAELKSQGKLSFHTYQRTEPVISDCSYQDSITCIVGQLLRRPQRQPRNRQLHLSPRLKQKRLLQPQAPNHQLITMELTPIQMLLSYHLLIKGHPKRNLLMGQKPMAPLALRIPPKKSSRSRSSKKRSGRRSGEKKRRNENAQRRNLAQRMVLRRKRLLLTKPNPAPQARRLAKIRILCHQQRAARVLGQVRVHRLGHHGGVILGPSL